CDTKEDVLNKLTDFENTSISDKEIQEKYSIRDNRDWHITNARQRITNEVNKDKLIINCSYRPFDGRWTYFDEGFSDYPRNLLKSSMLNRGNISIEISKQ